MSLDKVIDPERGPVRLEGQAPVPCRALAPLVDVPFVLPAADGFVHGSGDTSHGYLDAARSSWLDHPEYMDFLDPDSPCHDLKSVERDLYVHHWEPWWSRARTVLDVGCGVGRFTLPLLSRGATVWGVDADLESLRRLVWRAAGLEGRLDVSWSSVHQLPDVQVDVAIASEVLCYVPEAASALRGIAARVRPGGAVLLSVEARWGWALAPDAPRDRLAVALSGEGPVDVGEEGWVQPYAEEDVRRLVQAAGLEAVVIMPTHYVTDGPLEQVGPEAAGLSEILEADAACRAHPVWRPLNRIWTVVATRPP